MNPCPCGGTRDLGRRRTMTSVEVVTRCRECQNIERLSRRDVLALDLDTIGSLPFVVAKRRRRPNSKTRAYKAALCSAHTRKIREERFAMAGDECEVRGENCTLTATDLYHVTYERLGQERIDDVRASCSDCNADERQQRIARRVLGS